MSSHVLRLILINTSDTSSELQEAMVPKNFDLLQHAIEGNARRIADSKSASITVGLIHYTERGAKINIRSEEQYRIAIAKGVTTVVHS